MEPYYSNPFDCSSNNEEEQTVGRLFVYTAAALFFLLLGFLGNGVLS